jgi:hypothetical protein
MRRPISYLHVIKENVKKDDDHGDHKLQSITNLALNVKVFSETDSEKAPKQLRYNPGCDMACEARRER